MRQQKESYRLKYLICNIANIKKYVSHFRCGMFNLGYSPGGDKTVHTVTDPTLAAVKDGMELLEKGGVLVISVYPGHAEGTPEGEALYSEPKTLDKVCYSVIYMP